MSTTALRILRTYVADYVHMEQEMQKQVKLKASLYNYNYNYIVLLYIHHQKSNLHTFGNYG